MTPEPDAGPDRRIVRSRPGGPFWMRPVLGRFRVIEIAAVGVALVMMVGAMVLATIPLGNTQPPRQTGPQSSFYTLGAAEEGLRVGDQAPEFVGTADGKTVGLTDLAGNPIRLAELRGRPVWINFFATWCPPCQQETPVLRDLYAKYAPDGLALVAISVQEATIDDVRAFVQQYVLTYTVGFDGTSAIFHEYHAFGLPTHVFLDRSGSIRQIILGPITSTRGEQIISDLISD